MQLGMGPLNAGLELAFSTRPCRTTSALVQVQCEIDNFIVSLADFACGPPRGSRLCVRARRLYLRTSHLYIKSWAPILLNRGQFCRTSATLYKVVASLYKDVSTLSKVGSPLSKSNLSLQKENRALHKADPALICFVATSRDFHPLRAMASRSCL